MGWEPFYPLPMGINTYSVQPQPNFTDAEGIPLQKNSQVDPKEHWHTQPLFVPSISAPIMEIKGFFDDRTLGAWQVFTVPVK